MLLICGCNIHQFHKSEKRILQEELNEISFSRFLGQVDSKIWRVHLLIINTETIWELMITERKEV